MKRYSQIPTAIALCCVAIAVTTATSANAQCSTCAAPTPVVAYSPVVAAAPVVTYEPYRGWYPGKLLDNWRMRRYGYTAPTATYTAAYAPAYTAGYAPYTAAYAPTYTAGYAPYSVSYTPTAYTTNYSTPYVTSYAPLGQRQVLMRPVVVESQMVSAAPVMSSGCSSCSACEVAAPCSSCAASTVVEQATYATSAAPACSNCAQGSSITYSDSAPATSTGQTPQPGLTPEEAAPLRSNYPDVTPQGTQQTDPGPAAEDNSSESSTYFEPPALFIPGDRTAERETVKPINRAPSVNVWNAVYRQKVDTDNVSTTTARSQAEIDAAGWSSVPAN